MKMLQSSIIATSLLTYGLLSSGTASSAEICEFIGMCDNGCYTSTAKKARLTDLPQVMEACPTAALAMTTSDEYVSFKMPLDVAPGPMSLDLGKAGSNHYAEAWPQGDSITYSWSSTGSIVLDAATGTANPVRGFSCVPGTQGTITVTAFSPRNASETLTQTVSCQ
jgi:hypothetical protein